MAKRNEKEIVIKMRQRGLSYSQIREKVSVSKSTLSLWLRELPLTKNQIISLRDKSPKRIESFRNTMKMKREKRLLISYEEAEKTIIKLTDRDKFIAGIFLYFGEGSKTTKATTAVTNTNPVLLRFFIEWLGMCGVLQENIIIKLSLYEGMNIDKEIQFWCSELEVPRKQVRGPYIKKNTRPTLSGNGAYGHGTCTVLYENVMVYEKVLMYLKYTEFLMKSSSCRKNDSSLL